jgi:hypothetical protein
MLYKGDILMAIRHLIRASSIIVVLSISFGASLIANAEVIGAWLLDGDGRDSSGNGIHGEVMGDPEWVDGKFGKAMNGQPNKYVDFPPPKSEPLALTRDFTCMAWVKPTKWESGWNCAFSMQAGSSGGEIYGIYFGNQGGTEVLLWTKIVGQGSKSVTSGAGALNLNEWAHVTVTYDGTKMIAYQNGEPVGETQVSGDLDNGDKKGRFVIIGNYNSLDGGLGEWSSTVIDEVIIFDEALSQDRIRAYMEKGFQAVAPVKSLDRLSTTWGNIKQVL